MKPTVFFFAALCLAGVRAAPVPRTQLLTQNVSEDKLAIRPGDCTLARRGDDGEVSTARE
jgi:hypothetical protein